MVFDNFQPKIRSSQSSLFLFVLYYCIVLYCNAIALYNAWDEAHEVLSFTSDFSSSMANKDA